LSKVEQNAFSKRHKKYYIVKFEYGSGFGWEKSGIKQVVKDTIRIVKNNQVESLFILGGFIMKCCEPQKSNCCSTNCGCDCQMDLTEKKRVVVDFLYMDLNACTRCCGTEDVLEEAISDIAKVLVPTGTEFLVNKIHIDNEETAIRYRFKSSPTIRINGKDIQPEIKESLCESCGDLCGSETDCRVWVYKGKEYNVPPKAMIIDAVLKEIYGNERLEDTRQNEEKYELPDNLKEFFESMRRQEVVDR
jgi:hypothetical protein